MKQSRLTSLLKSILSTAVGFGVAMVANALVLPLFGYRPTLAENLAITTIYTAISIARGYVLERLFEAMGWRMRISPFMAAVMAERRRQIEVEGWSHEHDDAAHLRGDLARHGAVYALNAGRPPDRVAPAGWLWGTAWWKPAGFRRDLVKGCALIVAEGERFDRMRKGDVVPPDTEAR